MRDLIIDDSYCEDGALPEVYEITVSKRHDGSMLLEYLIPDRHLVSQIYYGYSQELAIKNFKQLLLREVKRV